MGALEIGMLANLNRIRIRLEMILLLTGSEGKEWS